jgi:hypothetical protein
MIPAIVLGIALLIYQFLQGLRMGSIDRIDPTDELALREVFFAEETGKQSYVVLCHDDQNQNQHAKNLPMISSVFADAFAEKSSLSSSSSSPPPLFRLLDCRHVLPDSGKTIAERFQLDLNKRPTIFVSGAVGEPKQVSISIDYSMYNPSYACTCTYTYTLIPSFQHLLDILQTSQNWQNANQVTQKYVRTKSCEN